jgi:serine/threonine protein kinase
VDPAKLQPDEIFCGAIELATPEERAAYLEQICGHDLSTRRRVERLLEAHSQAGGFLASPPAVGSGTIDLPVESVGTVIGPYKLLQPIGEGGMGAVWMAEQTWPVQRKVALKIIKAGMDSRQVLARFEAERQALAVMDHPNIAKVLDAGATATGRPFFVMELVKGQQITQYCDEHRLSPHQRLELFVSVCQAIQHAHQKGIIHRDIKPSNVLLAPYDGKPVVKVIDFGVAKATRQRLTEKTLFTELGAVIGTIEYMSPEQAELNNQDIDTRSDIYALGVLLYELLTGTTPLTRQQLKQAAFSEMLRLIREQEPPKPSTRLSDSKDSLPSVSAQRHIEPAKLTKLVRGDLDWIVMKALDKDRSRRYESAGTFAADVERYLKDEPVSAGPPGAGYRLRKFLRRNRGPVLAASLVISALVVGMIGTSIGLIQAQHAQRAEAERAEGERLAKETAQKRLTQIEKANDILGSIFKDLNPRAAEKDGKPLLVVLGERLDLATAQLEGEIIGDHLAVARMQLTLGESQAGLGRFEKAVPLLSKARATFTAQLGPDDPETPRSMCSLAAAYIGVGKLDLSLTLSEETLERRTANLPSDHLDRLRSMHMLASSYRAVGKLDRALSLYEETLKRMKATLPTDHPDTFTCMDDLAWCYQDAGKLDRAVPLYEEALERRKATLPPDHPDVLRNMRDLAWGYQAAGKLDRTLPLSEETLRLIRAKHGSADPGTLEVMNVLACAYQAAGKLDLALPLFEEVLRWKRIILPADHPNTLTSMNNLALCYQDAGKLDRALPLYEEALERRKATLPPPDHPDILQSMNNLAWGYLVASKLDLALPLYEQTLTRIKPKLGHDHPNTLMIMGNLGKGYIQTGQTAKAVPILRECLAIRETKEPDGWRTFDTKSMLGAALVGEKRYSEAEPLLLGGYEGLRQREATIPPVHKIRLIEALRRLVQLYDAWGKADEAARWRKDLEARKE